MQTIYKYPLRIVDKQPLTLPKGAQPLTVAIVANELVLYAQVDPLEQTKYQHTVRIFGTGHPIEETAGRYIGTGVMSDGLVWHVYLTESRT